VGSSAFCLLSSEEPTQRRRCGRSATGQLRTSLLNIFAWAFNAIFVRVVHLLAVGMI
jgi:hypothetical protein